MGTKTVGVAQAFRIWAVPWYKSQEKKYPNVTIQCEMKEEDSVFWEII